MFTVRVISDKETGVVVHRDIVMMGRSFELKFTDTVI